jgi:hypothetical protein
MKRSVLLMEVTVNKVLDANGLDCPMPIVKTKKEMTGLEPLTSHGNTSDC